MKQQPSNVHCFEREKDIKKKLCYGNKGGCVQSCTTALLYERPGPVLVASGKKTPQHYKSLMLESVLTHWMIITTIKLIQTTTPEVLIECLCLALKCVNLRVPPLCSVGPHPQVSLQENMFVTCRVCTEPEGKRLKHKAEIKAEG